MANVKLMREALEAIIEFWSDGAPLSPFAQIGDDEETISALVRRALNTDSDALPERDEGDVHLRHWRSLVGHIWVEFQFRTANGNTWFDNQNYSLKLGVDLKGHGNDFRVPSSDAETIVSLMEASGLEVRDYR